MPRPHLVFVYNADAGLFSALTDYAHKVLSPGTYPCSLCALTYGHLGMRRAWRRFVEDLDASVEFLHRDELAARYGVRDVALPVVFLRTEAGLRVGVDANALNASAGLGTLMSLVREALETE